MSDYPCIFCDGNHSSNRGPVHCIRILADRMKELESKLGAALSGISSVGATVGSGRHDATSDHNDTQQAGKAASGPPAAPSVSAEWWRQREKTCLECGRSPDARSAALAAAVTEWLDRYYNAANFSEQDVLRVHLINLAKAFVRGEPLPKKSQ